MLSRLNFERNSRGFFRADTKIAHREEDLRLRFAKFTKIFEKYCFSKNNLLSYCALEFTVKLSFALFVITGAKRVSITEITSMPIKSSAKVNPLFLCLNLIKARKNNGVIINSPFVS